MDALVRMFWPSGDEWTRDSVQRLVGQRLRIIDDDGHVLGRLTIELAVRVRGGIELQLRRATAEDHPIGR